VFTLATYLLRRAICDRSYFVIGRFFQDIRFFLGYMGYEDYDVCKRLILLVFFHLYRCNLPFGFLGYKGYRGRFGGPEMPRSERSGIGAFLISVFRLSRIGDFHNFAVFFIVVPATDGVRPDDVAADRVCYAWHAQ
jgi:hypothetical protein